VTDGRLQLLAARRLALTAQSDLLRAQLLQQAAVAHEAAKAQQLAVSGLRALARHPIALAAAIGLLLGVGPRRILGGVARLTTAWYLVRRAASVAISIWRLMRGA
jgi:hypothetical protein